MAKKKEIKVFDSNCLNCGYPFSGQENFCPECGQKNKGSKLTFSDFIKEVFAGFLSWDAKFWTTIIPLLTKPGKVSLDYIEGKRERYANPFRFYLSVSVIFFLLLGLIFSYESFKSLEEGSKEATTIEVNSPKEKKLSNSTEQEVKKEITRTNKKNNAKKIHIKSSFSGIEKMGHFYKFKTKHPKLSIDTALDSLHVEKKFTNRFWYSRANTIYSLSNNKEGGVKVVKQIVSYISITLFLLLPIFALLLKLFYFRKEKTYVDHLVFVFHVQTVLFLLLILFTILDLVAPTDRLSFVIVLLFGLYLFFAMKKFYNQGYFKTIIKFVMANILFIIFLAIGIVITSIFTFLFF